MILTINANAAVDIVMFIDRFRPGETMRTRRIVPSVGGKGLDTAVVLRALGAPLKAVSFVAGRNGEMLAELLQARQIDADLIWLAGETRIVNVIVETDYNRHSHITTTGYTVTAQDCQDFLQHIQQLAPLADWAVIAGSLPDGAPTTLYAEITRLLRQSGVKVITDCFGQPARDVLAAAPEIVKMNQSEFSMTFQVQPDNWDGWIQAVLEQMSHHRLSNFVLTCGKDGILAVTPQGIYQAQPPILDAVNAAGSGDAVSAALAYRLSLDDSWEQALHWAAAVSAAVVLTEGTAECRLEDVTSLYPRTSVQLIRPGETVS